MSEVGSKNKQSRTINNNSNNNNNNNEVVSGLFDWTKTESGESEAKRRIDACLYSYRHLERASDNSHVDDEDMTEPNQSNNQANNNNHQTNTTTAISHSNSSSKSNQTSFGSDLRPLPHPESLYLSNINLQRFPRQSLSNFSWSFIRDLYLDHNRLKVLDFLDLVPLKHLRMLNLKNNELKLLPDSLSSLAQLEFLYLDQNEITTIPDSIGALKHLQLLSISHNALTLISDGIGNCTRLESINLSFNSLSALPVTLHSIPLAKLQLEGNPAIKLGKASLPIASLLFVSIDINGERRIATKADQIVELASSATNCAICKKRQKNVLCILQACKKCCLSTRTTTCPTHGPIPKNYKGLLI